MKERALEIQKLKAALGESMSQEDIEKKLREKTQGTQNNTFSEEKEIIEDAEIIDVIEESPKNITEELEDKTNEEDALEEDKESIDKIEDIEEEKEEPVTFEIQMEEINPEKLALLNKRRTEEQKGKSSINIIIYIFSFVAILLMVFAGYLYMNKSTTAVKEIVIYKDSEPKEIIKEVIKEKIVPAEEIDDKQLKSYFNSNKFETYKCYDFKVGQATFPNECKTSLKEFLNKNKNSFKLEVTAVVSPDDIELINKAKLGNASVKMREYIVRGFSRERVLETSFYIKDFIKDDVILTPVNYYVTSKKLSKGVIIKAYYLEK